MANPAPGFEKHPGYEVTLEPTQAEVVVRVGNTEVARSNRAVQLLESRHNPVWYLPLADVNQEVIQATHTSTYCPFKGHASYWSVLAEENVVTDAIWAYMSPYDECAEIEGFASFYTDKVEILIDGQA